MEGQSDGSPPNSMYLIRAAELFPKPLTEKEDDKLHIPFQELVGESVKFLGKTDDGVLALSNYRLFLLKASTSSDTSVPLGLIESAFCQNLFQLIINCKDASTVKCSFPTSEQCTEWQRRIVLSCGVPENLESIFAFPFYAWVSEGIGTIDRHEWTGRLQRASKFEDDFRRESERLQFDLNGTWRISSANSDFKLCPSYPPLLLVPCCIPDDTLHNVASFRSSRRIPAVVWRHKQSGAIIARCSQPEVGWLGWRNAKDEQLLKALADACAFDRGEQTRRQNLNASGESTPSSAEGSHEEVAMDEVRKVLIVDARSYTSAVTNRARGGGCECAEYYPCAEIQFMSLGNIHVIRKSFQALRALCAASADCPTWLTNLERTMWLQHLSGLLAASMTVCHAIEKNGRPVLVHCSDGWDRTPQIVATALLCLDPYYRTVEGFRTLVEREWLSFGHKFADRCGHGPGSDDANERCPAFLQWLDVVHQIHRQFPCSFEFNMAYLIKLAQHSHSCLFGTFLCNTFKERVENSIFDRTFSVWHFLAGSMYRNPLYVSSKERVLWPAHNVRDLVLWSEVYLGSLGNQNSSDYPPNTTEGGNQESLSPMTKTRSYGDLMTAGGVQNGLTRRSSDPNMTVETQLITPINLSAGASDDEASLTGNGQLLANIIQDTTEKLQHLTNELNQSDEDVEICKINGVDSQTQLRNGNGDNGVAQSLAQSQADFETSRNLSSDNLCENKNNRSSFYNMNNSVVYAQTVKELSIGTDFNDPKCVGISNEAWNEDRNSHLSKGNRRRNSCDVVDSSRDFTSDASDNRGIMLESVDLREAGSPLNSNKKAQNLWYGSIETSIDTLVPIEHLNSSFNSDTVNSTNLNSHNEKTSDYYIKSENDEHPSTAVKSNTMLSSLYKDLPEVHSSLTICSSKPIASSIPTGLTAASMPKYPTHIHNNVIRTGVNLDSASVEESIIIRPEHRKLEISNNGNRFIGECIGANISAVTTHHHHHPRRRRALSMNSSSKFDQVNSPHRVGTLNGSTSPCATTNGRLPTSPGVRSTPLTPPGIFFGTSTNLSTTTDRPTFATLSYFPDGLAHALSEQNLRLQQIVYEHKLREDALQRELHGMRMAILKKTCPNCSNNPAVPANDDHADVNEFFLNSSNKEGDLRKNFTSENIQRNSYDENCPILFGTSPNSATYALDNMENLSNCSWEALDDRSGPSSGASSTNPSGSVLWVPDHAVSRCTGCQTEFWLGRRKHHCRSCGQIFCADCSEFWAPLPDERLYSPVRLCGPCYHDATKKIQHQQAISCTFSGDSSSSSSSTYTNQVSSIASKSASSNYHQCVPRIAQQQQLTSSLPTATSSKPIEACKHGANLPRNDTSSLKATTASN